MKSQPREQAGAILILRNISKNKGNQTMKKTFLLKNRPQNKAEKLF